MLWWSFISESTAHRAAAPENRERDFVLGQVVGVQNGDQRLDVFEQAFPVAFAPQRAFRETPDAHDRNAQAPGDDVVDLGKAGQDQVFMGFRHMNFLLFVQTGEH